MTLPTNDSTQPKITPHLQKLKQQNQQKKNAQKKKKALVPQKQQKQGQSEQKKRRSLPDDAKKLTAAPRTPKPQEPLDLSILKKSTTPVSPKHETSKKRKREFLSDAIVNEFEAKKRKIEKEEKMMPAAEVSMAPMKEHRIERHVEEARKVISNALAPNVDVEIVYKEEITDPMDMPLKAPTEVIKFLHSHFYEQKQRVSTSLYMLAKQKVRKFKPAYNFVTKSNEEKIREERIGSIVNGDEEQNGGLGSEASDSEAENDEAGAEGDFVGF